MIVLWIAAAFLAAAAAALMAYRAAAAPAAGSDGAAAVYQRQLGEIDELAERGLIGEAERASARAETGRRLLAASAAPAAAPGRRLPERTILALASVPAVAALALYLFVGSPALGDAPFAARLADWKAHPQNYGPDEWVAVLEGYAAANPADPKPLEQLARLYLNQGRGDDAARVLRRLGALTPNEPQIWTALGELAVVKANGAETAEARALFERALKLDANAVPARYHLGRGKIAAGDAAGGLADWRLVLAAIPASDPLREGLAHDIGEVEKTGKLPPPPRAAAPERPQITAAIRQMVDGLAARLKTQPDDPQGWVRLVRAYSVMGESAKRDAALAEASGRFRDRPQVLSELKAAAAAPAQ